MLVRFFTIGFAAFACAVSPVTAGERTFMFDVPESSVDVALNSIAQQANAQVLFPFDKVKSIKAKTVSGEYTLAEALRLTLDETGLAADFTKSGVIMVMFSSEKSKFNGEDQLPMKTERKLSLLSKVVLAVFGVGSIHGVAAQDFTSSGGGSVVEEVIVKGVRKSLRDGLSLKRDSVGVVDGIIAEDIADFPDLNIGEALQRITGVTLDRTRNGEGSRISVRGLPPSFTRTTLNGISAASSGGNSRGFDFDVFASELFSSVSLTKIPSADMTEGGLAGTVGVLLR